jgi:pimeloyl-ACP methyl ester carboxylesterase
VEDEAAVVHAHDRHHALERHVRQRALDDAQAIVERLDGAVRQHLPFGHGASIMFGLHHVEQGAGPPLLLIHGTGGDADVWRATIPLLAARHRVIAYDRRGFGRSAAPFPARKDAYAAHADDARALLDELVPGEPACVVGWSAGGIVALHLAVAHPERVRALVLIEPPLWARRERDLRLLVGMVPFLWHAARGRARRSAAAFFRTVTRYRDGGNAFDAMPPERRERMLASADAIVAEIRAGTGEELTPARLGTIRCPVTLLLGERSPPLYARLGRKLAAALPSLRTATVAGGGHLMMVEAPKAFAEAVDGAC